MMMPDIEDLHDNGMGENGMGDLGEMGGAPESGLPLLPADAMSIGRQDGGRRDDRSWSEFLRRQQDINMDSLWDFIRDNKPDSHEGRMVMQNLASAAIYTITAQALQIKRQHDDFKAREKEIKRELKKEEEDAATALYGRWAQGNAMQQYLACIKHRYGYGELERREPPYEEDEDGVPVPVASGARWDWHMADWDMREADREAIFSLSARAHELYQVWQDMGRLRRQQNENRARRMPDIDVSDWLAKVKSGKSTNTEKLLGGTYLIQEMVAFGLAHQGDKNPHWLHLEKLFRGSQEQAARRSGWFRRKQSMSDGGGDPEGGSDA